LSGRFGALPPNPINDAQFFVRQHYLDFLSREPDPGGASYRRAKSLGVMLTIFAPRSA
jgi:hypothetical protein